MIDTTVETAITHAAGIVTPETPVTDAAQHLRDPDVPALVVRDGAEAVVGIVTESDVVALVAETDELATVDQCMSAPVTTVRPTATVTEAAERMCSEGVKHLPVVDGRGDYHGVVSTETLAPYCSRRSLDVTWASEPLEVDASDVAGVPAHD